MARDGYEFDIWTSTVQSVYIPIFLLFFNHPGDTCCFPFSLGSVTKMLKSKISDSLYVKSIRIGESIITDYESGFFVHPNKQVR